MRSLCPFFTHTARAQKLLPAPRSPHEACSVDAHRTWARRPLLLFIFISGSLRAPTAAINRRCESYAVATASLLSFAAFLMC
jgi:hypothetical protein